MRLPALVVTCLVVAFVATPSPALADTATFSDASGDVRGVPYVDFTRVTVSNSAKRIKVTYRSRSADNMIGTEFLWLDTDPSRPGPELEVGFARFSEGWTIPLRNWKRDRSAAAKRKWSTSPMTRGRCDGTVRVKYNSERSYSPLTMTIKQRAGCIKAKRVRVHLRSASGAYAPGSGGGSDPWPIKVTDDFPNRPRAFTPWVRQGRSGTFVDDADHVPWWNDIQDVTATLTTGSARVEVLHRARPDGRSGEVRVYFDTNGDAAPEWVASLTATGSSLSPTRPDWSTSGGPLNCNLDGRFAWEREAVSRVTIPAGCLGYPAQMSIAVQTQDYMFNLGPSDWLTGERAWSGPVLAGGIISPR